MMHLSEAAGFVFVKYFYSTVELISMKFEILDTEAQRIFPNDLDDPLTFQL